MGKIDNNKKYKKETLLNTAFDLFTTKGINKTSISDIVDNAGVAKGTFYLYFSDKYDIRNKLVSHKASQIFINANRALKKTDLTEFEDRLVFLADNIINQFCDNKALLTFISKNLSCGIFKSALASPTEPDDLDFSQVYELILSKSNRRFKNPELMLFMIIELVSSTCYSTILYNEPTTIDELKPYLYNTIRQIIEFQEIN